MARVATPETDGAYSRRRPKGPPRSLQRPRGAQGYFHGRKQKTFFRNDSRTSRTQPRPDNPLPRRSRLPDFLLRLQERRTRGQPLRTQGVRQHLFPLGQSHERDPGEPREPARGRRRFGGGRLGHGGDIQHGHHHRQSGRRDRIRFQPLWRHLHHVRRHPPRPWDRHEVRECPQTRLFRGGHQRKNPAPLYRDNRQSRARPRGHRRDISHRQENIICPSSWTPPSPRPIY